MVHNHPPSPSKVAVTRPITRNRCPRNGAGLDSPRPHDLRHARASFPLTSGASPRAVTKAPGHSRIGLIMNTYTHVLLDIKGDPLRHE
ncbi:tyrosine-type recombinase/integrase [Streptosporangium subroseum]|uniref:tyrosine-type recombinase/integrase n=1 Tax=Streptosporangium subroseum TaxID=106412 RepID=UPI00352CEA4F